MLRLNYYEFNNFKNITESGRLSKKYLTVFTGVNSGGKSTLIQPLLVLKDLVLNKNPHEIDFTGTYVELGDYKDVAKDPSKPIQFRFSLGIEKDSDNQNLFLDILDNMNLKMKEENVFLEKKQNNYVRIDILFEIGIVVDKVRLTKFHVRYACSDVSNYCNITYLNNGYYIDTNNFSKTFDKDFYLFMIERNINILVQSEDQFSDFFKNEYTKVQVVFDNNLYPKIVYPINKKRHTSNTLQINGLYNHILREILEEFSNNINYLGPLRDDPKLNYYIRKNVKDEIGTKGENAPVVFYQLREKDRHKFLSPPNEEGRFNAEKSFKPFTYFVNGWASYILGSPISFDVEKFGPQNYGLFQIRNNSSHSMTNVGVGSSQLFPILVEGIRKKNGVLIIEQPELHLHPNAQARLADFLIAVSMSNYMRLLIETHSEHLINRVVRRIVRREIEKKSVDIRFINQQGIQEIKLNEMGIIAEWPEDFFDTYLKEQEKLYIDQMNHFHSEVNFDEL
ncbi:AAA family ATPase [Paenibacillus alba]|uniref:DUF3696 domain-containing protein n=1 Tax=Paenibacillus alba TaxID=1197127 RepID=UPI001567B52F|nr:DUF3696 domain-containing protein [Paenibacillus alba]NQX71808.1 AAA family ATPase [Paenibacillus alba]